MTRPVTLKPHWLLGLHAQHASPRMIAQGGMGSHLCLTECITCMLHVLELDESASCTSMHPCEMLGYFILPSHALPYLILNLIRILI